MGKTRGPYKIEFPEGILVRIASRPDLKRFQRDRHFYHPLKPQQLDFPDQISAVARTGNLNHAMERTADRRPLDF